MNDFSLITEAESKWKLTKANEECVVEKKLPQCFCTLRCPYCEICLHSFVCSCYESSIRWNMCPHIHIIGMYLKNNQDIDDNHPDQEYRENEEKTTKICLDSINFLRDQNLNSGKETIEDILKSELIDEFSREIGDLKTKEEYEVVKKLVSFVGPALEAVRQNQASLNSLTLYF